MRHVNCIALSGVDTGSVDGSQMDSIQIKNVSFQIVFGDATAAGTFKIQASNDICNDSYQAQNFTATNWSDVPNATASITSGASAIISLQNCAFRWLRAVYTRTSGGSTTVVVNMNALSDK